jgi:hypothetical protein
MRKIVLLGTTIGLLMALPVHAAGSEQLPRPTTLRCESINTGFVIMLKIQGEFIWTNDRLQKSYFSDFMIEFEDDAMPDFLHRLDRTNGRMIVYNSKKQEIDSIYDCQKIDKVMF